MSAAGAWRFAVVADTHLGAADGHGVMNPAAGSAMPDRLRRLGPALAGCDFCLHLGDVVNSGSAEELAAARELLAAWPCPTRICFGNHDAMSESGVARWLAACPDAFGDGGGAYSFDRHGLHFVVLQTHWLDREGGLHDWWQSAWACVWQLPEPQLTWLDADLTAHADRPTIVCHHPLSVPLGSRLHGGDPVHGPPRPESGEELHAVLRRHPQVRVVLGGHAHAHQIESSEGIVHVATAAAIEWPYEWRSVTVDGDRLTVETHPWPLRDSLMVDDADARTPWAAGQAVDRRRVIPLGP